MSRQAEEKARGKQAVYTKLEKIIDDLKRPVKEEDANTTKSFGHGVDEACNQILERLKGETKWR